MQPVPRFVFRLLAEVGLEGRGRDLKLVVLSLSSLSILLRFTFGGTLGFLRPILVL